MKNSVNRKIILLLIATFLLLSHHLFAKKVNQNSKAEINTAYDDSLSMLNASAGDIFVVDASEYIVYTSKKEIETMNPLDWGKVTLSKGDKFKVLEILRLKIKLGALIALPDSSKAYIVNLVTLPKYCYKEGTSPMNGRIERSLDTMMRYTHKEFWIVLGITLLISVLFFILSGTIDKTFYKWSGRKQNIIKPGFALLATSAFFGALAGLTVLFFNTEFKDFVLHLPAFSFPGESGFIIKFYWSLQLFFLVFYGWAVFRSIREFGTKAGIVRSLILLIPAFTIFWTALATSFVAVVGFLIALFMGAMASDLEKGPQASTVIKEEYQTGTGERKTVRINYDAQGRSKSKKYI